MRQSTLLAFFSFILLPIMLIGCAWQSTTPTPAPAPVPTPPTPAPAPTPTPSPTPKAAETEIVVTVKYATFQPSTITVFKDQPVRLIITSTDTSHTFIIAELGIDVAVPAGQTVIKEFTVEKQAGTFPFYCDVPGHQSAGGEGTFKVVYHFE